MSEFEILPTAVGGIMVVSVFVVAVMMSGIAFGNSVKMQTEDLNMISERSALHIVEDCLKQDKDFIDSAYLESVKGKSIDDVCGICYDGYIAFKVSAAGRSWESKDYKEPLTEEDAHEMFVNVMINSDIVIGKMILRV